MKASRILTISLFLGICGLATAEDALEEHPERKDVIGVGNKDKEMQAAYEKARESLPEFIKALEKREKGARYLLKVRMEEDGDAEHVWLEPVKWNDPGLIGILAVDPVHVTKYKRGDVVAPFPKEISDWLILFEDGTKKGGYTVDVIEKHRKEAQKTEQPEE